VSDIGGGGLQMLMNATYCDELVITPTDDIILPGNTGDYNPTECSKELVIVLDLKTPCSLLVHAGGYRTKFHNHRRAPIDSSLPALIMHHLSGDRTLTISRGDLRAWNGFVRFGSQLKQVASNS